MICRTYDVPGATLDQYDAVNKAVGTEKPDGVHAHIAMRTNDGFRVIELWDSSDASDRYMQSRLSEAMKKADLPQPTITDFEVHMFGWED